MTTPIPNPYKMGVDNLEIADPITGIWHIERNRSGNWRFTGPGREWSGYHTKSEAIARCKEAIEAARIRGGGEPTMPEGFNDGPGVDGKTPEQRERHRLLRKIYCIHDDEHCGGPSELSHLPPPRDAGENVLRRDHDRTTQQCRNHHQDGGYGIAIHAGRDAFEANYGSIREIMRKTNWQIAELAKLEAEGVVLA